MNLATEFPVPVQYPPPEAHACKIRRVRARTSSSLPRPERSMPRPPMIAMWLAYRAYLSSTGKILSSKLCFASIPTGDESATATGNPDWVPNPRDKVERRRPAAQVFRERRFSGSRHHGRVLQFFAAGTQLLEQRQYGAGEEQPCADSAAANPQVFQVVGNEPFAGHLEVLEHVREVGESSAPVFGKVKRDYLTIEAGMSGLVAADEIEYRFEGFVVLERGVVFLRFVSEIGGGFL